MYNDTNLDGKFDGGDTGVGGGTVTVTGGPTTVNPITVAANGTWTTPTNLLSGSYTVKYTTALPAGYTFQTSNTYIIKVGDPAAGARATVCSTGGNPDGVCGGINNGSVSGVDIGMTNEHSHYGSVCLDIRTDNNGGGTVADLFPAPGATCGGVNGSQAISNNGTCSTGSGIAFSCNGTFDFGLGTADANNWTAGGTAAQDTECYSGGGLDVIPTSYGFLTTTARQSNITPTNLDNLTNPDPTTSCTLTDCVLPSSLPKGIYLSNGDLTLDAATYTFPAPLNPNTTSQAYIILVNGNLTIKGNIHVPKGSVVVFSASGNITIDPGVGNTITDPNSTTVNTPNLEGVYSADGSVIVQSNASGGTVCNANGTPLDKRLVVLGVVISNAAKNGGTFTNNRDLCVYDTSCSSVEIGDGINAADQGLLMNYLLNLMADGQFLSIKNFNWKEVKP